MCAIAHKELPKDKWVPVSEVRFLLRARSCCSEGDECRLTMYITHFLLIECSPFDSCYPLPSLGSRPSLSDPPSHS